MAETLTDTLGLAIQLGIFLRVDALKVTLPGSQSLAEKVVTLAV